MKPEDDAPAQLDVQAPSAEVAEARRRDYVAEVHDRPGFEAALAGVARLDGDAIAEEMVAARATVPRADAKVAPAAAIDSAKGNTVKRGLRAPAIKTAPSLRAMIEQRPSSKERILADERPAAPPFWTRARVAWTGAIALGLAGVSYALWSVVIAAPTTEATSRATAMPTEPPPAPTDRATAPSVSAAADTGRPAQTAEEPSAKPVVASAVSKTASPTSPATAPASATTAAPTASAPPTPSTASAKPNPTDDIPYIHGRKQ